MPKLSVAKWRQMFAESDLSTIYYAPTLRALWPFPLAETWRAAYPQVFDDSDLRQLHLQPGNHFREWLTAVHHHHVYGVSVLVEKYMCSARSHPRKHKLLGRVVGQSGAEYLRSLVRGGQPPDLLVYAPDFSRYWFVEVKAVGEPPTDKQPGTFESLRRELGARIELVTVETVADGLAVEWEASVL